MPKAASEKLSFINDYDREHDTDYFEELREEIYEETDGIVDNVHVDMYGLTKNTFRGTEDKPYYTEENYKNAVKIMFKKINDCYKKLISESEDPEEGMHY
jgi:hypothetical protein